MWSQHHALLGAWDVVEEYWCLQPAMGFGGSWALLCLGAKPHPLWCIDTTYIGWEMTLPRLGVQKDT